MARSQRFFLHPVGVELFYGGYEASGQGSARCHGKAERHDRTHLAHHADLRPRHGGDTGRDGAVPGRILEGDASVVFAGIPPKRIPSFAGALRITYCGVSRKPRVWPLWVPMPTIWPAELIPLACIRTQPEPAGIMLFKSLIFPPL